MDKPANARMKGHDATDLKIVITKAIERRFPPQDYDLADIAQFWPTAKRQRPKLGELKELLANPTAVLRNGAPFVETLADVLALDVQFQQTIAELTRTTEQPEPKPALQSPTAAPKPRQTAQPRTAKPTLSHEDESEPAKETPRRRSDVDAAAARSIANMGLIKRLLTADEYITAYQYMNEQRGLLLGALAHFLAAASLLQQWHEAPDYKQQTLAFGLTRKGNASANDVLAQEETNFDDASADLILDDDADQTDNAPTIADRHRLITEALAAYLPLLQQKEEGLPFDGRQTYRLEDSYRELVGLLNIQPPRDLKIKMLFEAVAANKASYGGNDADHFAAARQHYKALFAERDRIRCHNMGLVFSAARQKGKSSLPLSDLAVGGTLGLIRAIEGFDPTRGASFSTYAFAWIDQAISKTINDEGPMIRIPIHAKEDARRIYHTEEQFYKKRRRYPTPEELAALTGMSKRLITRLSSTHLLPVASLDAPIKNSEGETTVADFIPTQNGEEAIVDATNNAQLKIILTQALGQLPPRLETILRLRNGIHPNDAMTLEQVGERFHYTRERVRQLEAQALRRLRAQNSGLRATL